MIADIPFDFEELFVDSLTEAQRRAFMRGYRMVLDADINGEVNGREFSLDSWHLKFRRMCIFWAVTRDTSEEMISIMMGSLTTRELVELRRDIAELGGRMKREGGVNPPLTLAA